jgi:hypothetical protein
VRTRNGARRARAGRQLSRHQRSPPVTPVTCHPPLWECSRFVSDPILCARSAKLCISWWAMRPKCPLFGFNGQPIGAIGAASRLLEFHPVHESTLHPALASSSSLMALFSPHLFSSPRTTDAQFLDLPRLGSNPFRVWIFYSLTS